MMLFLLCVALVAVTALSLSTLARPRGSAELVVSS